jgi:putative oxidoreductase
LPLFRPEKVPQLWVMKDLCRALLILLFVYAATAKLLDFNHFKSEMAGQPFPPAAAKALTYLLPAAELVAAGLLTAGRKAGDRLALALMAAFSGYTGLVLAGYFSRVPCACGGILNGLGWGAHFAFNGAFLAISILNISQKGNAENLRKE